MYNVNVSQIKIQAFYYNSLKIAFGEWGKKNIVTFQSYRNAGTNEQEEGKKW